MVNEGPKQLRTRSFQSNIQPPPTVAQIAAPRSVNDKNSEPQASKQIISSNNNLEIERCTFTGLSGVRYTFGGAIFARSANLFLLQDKFTDNIAVMGGGVASVHSPYTRIVNCTFKRNRGFVAGGGLLGVNGGASAILTPQMAPKGTIRSYDYPSGLSSTSNFGPSTVFIQKCNFTECQSQYAGGVLFENQADVIIDNSRIEKCYSDMEGGGGGFTNSMVYIQNSTFYYNHCGLPNRTMQTGSELSGFPDMTRFILYDTWFTKRKHFIPPGAPAFFYFTTIPPPDPSFSNSFAQIPQLELVTQHCCFYKNLHIDSSDYFSQWKNLYGSNEFPIYSTPKEILFAGYSIYRSYSDSFTDNNNSIFYAKGRLNIVSSFVLLIWQIQIPNACGLANSDYYTRTYIQTSVIDPQSEALTFDEEASQASATSTISTPPTIDLPNQINSTPITRTAEITISRLQSNTPSHSQSPTCSTGDFNSKETPRQTANIYITVFAYFYHPNLTTSPSVTSTGASWPIQTHVSLNSPTASTASGIIAIPQITISTATQSWHGEVPNPSFTPTCTFEHFPSQSAVATVTLLGDIWPNQTFYPNWTPTASTASGNEAVPHRSHSTVTHSYYGEIPNPSRTPTISFDKEPSRSLTASATSTGASWPQQSSVFGGTPTASTGSGPDAIPRRTISTKTRSCWGENPHPPQTNSISFAAEPSQSLTASVTSARASWPSQTVSETFLPSPTASTGSGPDAIPRRSISTHTESSWGENPNPSQTPSVSFNGLPSQSMLASVTLAYATWPNQTFTMPAIQPPRTLYGEIPDATISSATHSHYNEMPNPTATRSISFWGENPYSTALPPRTKSPSRSNTPAGYSDSITISSTVTFIESFIEQSTFVPIFQTITFTLIGIVVTTETYNGITWINTQTNQYASITTYTLTVAPVPTIITTESAQELVVMIPPPSKEKDEFPLKMIIGIAVGILLLVIITGVLIWWFYVKKKQPSPAQTESEMVEETVVTESNKCTITYDNPLFQDHATSESDDPFREDFEEDLGTIIFAV